MSADKKVAALARPGKTRKSNNKLKSKKTHHLIVISITLI